MNSFTILNWNNIVSGLGKIVLLVLLILFFNYGSVTANNAPIKIGLMDDAKDLTISSDAGLEVKTSDGYSLDLTEDSSFHFAKTGKFIRINNYFFDSDYLMISAPANNDLVNIDARDYKGKIKLFNTGQTMNVINQVGFKDYLASVIGSEIDPEWPMEAIKAQAVVARTYALCNLNSYASQGYNLSNTIYSQAYKGDHVTTSKTYQAVEETAGEVLTYKGELISAVYHSNSGGKTAQGSTVWGGDTPYLQSVDSKDSAAPHYQWQKEYTIDQLEEILALKKSKLEDIKAIKLESVGPSGRPSQVVIEGANREISVDSSKFRFWLDLRSTKFSVTKLEDGYLFEGNGWGHGVGMSQWGAYQMAIDGFEYREILDHYYQNTKLVKKDFGGIDNEG
ncbi:MAG: SpoIID/LytB domain-containing protein [Bacillota bacterium]